MFERLTEVFANNPATQMRALKSKVVIDLTIGDEHEYVDIDHGVLSLPKEAPGRLDITLSAAKSDWEEFLSDSPAVGFQTLAGMMESGHLSLSGDGEKFYRYMMLLETLVTGLRNKTDDHLVRVDDPQIEDVVGHYLRLNIDGRAHRVYFEEAGQGTPLLCLHTAGADGRQYRALLNDPEITKNFRVIVFDLPAHGKSSPPAGFDTEVYMLTTDKYVSTVMAIKEALKLENPVVMGCSIGGRAVLHLALRHGKDFKAAIGLQSALYAQTSGDALQEMMPLYRPDMHGPEVSAASVYSLMAPSAPNNEKWETLWHYMQGGPGIFAGDLYYYFVDGDLRNGLAKSIDTSQCPLYMLSGEYDLSATPEMGQELADEVGATYFKVMKGLGHFPMSEDPEQFRSYLLPVLEMIKNQKAA